ncbi:MAG TPA: flagellar biosynthetic protein FliO [Terriglobales bacterium]|nr:flagellar biosynthetic protein FliO [Terriglobales bacterium]
MSNRRITPQWNVIRRAARRLRTLFASCHPRPQPRLRLCESLQLGDRRFVSVVEFGQQKFLVGGTANSLAMLAVLRTPGDCHAAEEDFPIWTGVEGELVREVQHG